jgi:hypothetical protein
MYHLAKGIKLNLPPIIIQHMIHVANSRIIKVVLPYGTILTKIFRKYHIDETSQRIENLCTPFGLKNIHHMKKEITAEEFIDFFLRKSLLI